MTDIFMKVIHILSFIGLLSGCDANTQKENTKTVNAPGIDKTQPANVNCYSYAGNGDSISLKIMHEGNGVSGTLVYKLKEKDKNEGTLQGSINNNILVADYYFMSEGTRSIRQVAFKLENNSFVEGFGETISTGNKVSFKHVDSLNFNSQLKLTEIPCL